MKLIIAGSRGFADYDLLEQSVKHFIVDNIEIGELLTIISGTAKGADKLGEEFATKHNLPLILKPADWNKHGKSAGYKRNEEMAQIATHCIAFWDGESKGTKHMIDLCKKYNILCHIVDVKINIQNNLLDLKYKIILKNNSKLIESSFKLNKNQLYYSIILKEDNLDNRKTLNDFIVDDNVIFKFVENCNNYYERIY